jgi:chaperonin GroES
MNKLEALFDAIIIKPFSQDEMTYGSIIVPDMGKEKNLSGTIAAVGPGKWSFSGDKFLNTTVEVGQKVILPQMGPTKFEFEGEEYYICSENQLLAIIND